MSGVLCKVIAHDICLLIDTMHTLGMERLAVRSDHAVNGGLTAFRMVVHGVQFYA